jgi:hypothetical protein
MSVKLLVTLMRLMQRPKSKNGSESILKLFKLARFSQYNVLSRQSGCNHLIVWHMGQSTRSCHFLHFLDLNICSRLQWPWKRSTFKDGTERKVTVSLEWQSRNVSLSFIKACCSKTTVATVTRIYLEIVVVSGRNVLYLILKILKIKYHYTSRYKSHFYASPA